MWRNFKMVFQQRILQLRAISARHPKHIIDPVTSHWAVVKLVPWFEARYPKNVEIKRESLRLIMRMEIKNPREQ